MSPAAPRLGRPGRAVLLSWHLYDSPRRAGFHFLADALSRLGFDVLFVTTHVSWASLLSGGGPRARRAVLPAANRVRSHGPGVQSYVWLPPWHPFEVRSPALARLAAPVLRLYPRFPLGPVTPLLRDAALLLFESAAGLALLPRLRRLSPGARLAYRVSDDIRDGPFSRVVLDAEERALPAFDVVSVPTRLMLDRFAGHPRARLDFHGIRKDLFDRPSESPYGARFERNAVFTGVSKLDREAVALAAAARPRWGFHVIGPFAGLPAAPNVIGYGELPFERTIAFVKHADLGLHTLEAGPAAATFTDSLKVIQYTYCRLPIVSPDHIPNWRPNVFFYRAGDAASIARALDAAAAFDRARTVLDGIRSWDELAGVLAGEREEAPPAGVSAGVRGGTA
jgi:2-beta-glucuronyltransferase